MGDCKWRTSQHFQELPDDCSGLSMCLNNLKQMARRGLIWGAHATVALPQTLADRKCSIATASATRYK